MRTPVRYARSVDEMLRVRIRKDSDGCWVWLGCTHNGYGAVTRNGRSLQAHRLVFETLREPIPHGAQIDHRCRNRACVNPEHLRLASQSQNNVNKARRPKGYSRFRGVTKSPRNLRKPWIAQLTIDGRNTNLGYFATEEEAAAAWQLAARRHYGDFAPCR